MAQYFFHFITDGNVIEAMEGVEIFELRNVRAEAIAILPDITRSIRLDSDSHIFAVVVNNATGEPVFRVELSLNCTWLK